MSTSTFQLKNIFATLPRTQRGQPLVLGGDPKGRNFLYTNGNSVIIRDINNPAICDVYTEHSCAVNVAKYSPSGFYIASGDQSGKIRIWDTVNPEHLLKNEFQPIGGPIKDIAWSADNQRMVVGGEGRERFGHVFATETGTSVGEISGQSKAINSCDFRPVRPFRIVTGSEDNTVAVFEGPPFKFRMTKQEHTRFVQAVRYSRSGALFASAGFDGRVYLYNGATSELVGEVGEPAHNGGVYAVDWSADARQLLTVSGDKTAKLWDVETKQLVTEFPMGSAVEDQQVSCLWQAEHLLTVSLSGFINYLDVNSPKRPLRILKGHNKPITVLTLTDDHSSMITGSYDGHVTRWDISDGSNERVLGVGHGNQINGLCVAEGKAYTCGFDDTLKQIDLEGKMYENQNVKLPSQPRAMAMLPTDSVLIVGTVNEVVLCDTNHHILQTIKVDFEPSCVAAEPQNKHVAVGGATDNTVHFYTFSSEGGSKELKAFDSENNVCHSGGITDVAYSKDGKFLAVCDTNRKVKVYSLPNYELAIKVDWGFHTARVNCVSWSPDSELVASGSLDTNIMIWSIKQPSKRVTIKNAHMQSQITRLVWVDRKTLVSVGQDCNTKLWKITRET